MSGSDIATARTVTAVPAEDADGSGASAGESSSRSAADGGMPPVGRCLSQIRRTAIGLGREVWAVTASTLGDRWPRAIEALAGSAGSRPVPTIHGTGRTAPPVVLVHGFAGSKTSWFALSRALRADGRTVVSFDYRPWGASIEELADQLTEAVLDVLATSVAGTVRLVGHSLGGVIIALALTDDRLAGRVDQVVTLGSPFHGSPWAPMLPLSSLARAVRPGSPVLRRLATAAPQGVRWLAFASTLDPVVPARSALPAHEPATRVTVDAAGHCGMLVDPVVIERVVAAISDVPRAASRRDGGVPHAAAAA